MRLKDSSIKSFVATENIVRHTDGEGLSLLIYPSGKKTWIFTYRYEGKQIKLKIGQYPYITLKDARKAREDARNLLERGLNPATWQLEVEEQTKLNLFTNIAEKWFTLYKGDHAQKSIAIYRNILDVHILPKIGHMAISEIKRIQLIDLVETNTIFKTIRDRSQHKGKMAASTAQKTCFCLSMIFEYALNLGLVEYSVATKLTSVLPDPEYSNYRTVIKKEDVKNLIQAIRTPGYAATSVWYFLNIMPYVFVRNTELRLAKWEEFDLELAEWYIPGIRMKGKKLDKNTRPPHFVPLSTQVVELLKELKEVSTSEYLFPSINNKTRCISDAAPLVSLKRFGICQTVHGFRTIASTNLHELNYPTHIIEAQMAHKDENKIRATYNKAQYKEERIKMMQEWANYLDNLVKA